MVVGSWFGEGGALFGKTLSAEVYAAEPTTCLVAGPEMLPLLPASLLDTLRSAHPEGRDDGTSLPVLSLMPPDGSGEEGGVVVPPPMYRSLSSASSSGGYARPPPLKRKASNANDPNAGTRPVEYAAAPLANRSYLLDQPCRRQSSGDGTYIRMTNEVPAVAIAALKRQRTSNSMSGGSADDGVEEGGPSYRGLSSALVEVPREMPGKRNWNGSNLVGFGAQASAVATTELVESMRRWVRENGRLCACGVTAREKSTAGRPRAAPAGCKVHWRQIANDRPSAPPPHHESLITRFCREQGVPKKRSLFRPFASALAAEGFPLPHNPTERNMLLSDGTMLDHVGGFVFGWMDVRNGEAVDEAPVMGIPPPEARRIVSVGDLEGVQLTARLLKQASDRGTDALEDAAPAYRSLGAADDAGGAPAYRSMAAAAAGDDGVAGLLQAAAFTAVVRDDAADDEEPPRTTRSPPASLHSPPMPTTAAGATSGCTMPTSRRRPPTTAAPPPRSPPPRRSRAARRRLSRRRTAPKKAGITTAPRAGAGAAGGGAGGRPLPGSGRGGRRPGAGRPPGSVNYGRPGGVPMYGVPDQPAPGRGRGRGRGRPRSWSRRREEAVEPADAARAAGRGARAPEVQFDVGVARRAPRQTWRRADRAADARGGGHSARAVGAEARGLQPRRGAAQGEASRRCAEEGQ